MLKATISRVLDGLPYLAVMPLGILTMKVAEYVGLEIPNQPVVLGLALAYCAYRGGLALGLIGSAIHLSYSVVFFSEPGHLFVYSRESLLRILVWSVAGPTMATMMGLLKLQADRLLESQKASEAALARLNVELEERVRTRTAELGLALDRAEQASRAKSMFLATMSHELRTPLNAVIGFSDIIGREILGPIGNAKYREYAGDILKAGRHLLGLINDILDMSKIEARKMDLVEEEVDLAILADECVKTVAGQAEAGGVALALEMSCDLPHINGDAMRLKQILLNLLSNAVKFTPFGGHVTVEATIASGGDMVITIADDGIGMEAEELAVAKQPFRQIDSSLARRFEGTGLGLPLTELFLELHGGRLEIESEAGRGTIARVIIPAQRVLATPIPALDAQTTAAP